MGRPVVATSLGATPENLVDGVTGWLVPPNDPAALAAGIERVLALDAGHLTRLAEIARSRIAERCSLDSMTGATLQVYRQVLEARAGRQGNGQHGGAQYRAAQHGAGRHG